jgi:DNA-binding NarL/FixJ family response regulator
MEPAYFVVACIAMSDRLGYRVSLLEDRASVWSTVEPLLDVASQDPAACEIGLLGWSAASREEIAQLSKLRAEHACPLVAVVREMPGARGARAIAARLEGAVLAGDVDRALRPTLEAVAAGQCVVPQPIRQIVDRPPLSPRERQILAMVVIDFSNAEIARKLFVSESNVKNHLSSAFQKLGVKSRSAAAELILDGESGLGPGILRISPEESLPEIG